MPGNCVRVVVSFIVAFMLARGGWATDLAISHVAVIDPSDGSLASDMTVIIRGDRILSVAHRSAIPRGATVIDGRGKYLIPGLWDMHVHLGSIAQAEKDLPQAVAAGVTGLRDMGTPLNAALAIRAAVRRDHGPELYVSGPLLNGPLPFKTPLIENVTTPEEAVATVRRLLAAGVDFIKVHDVLGAPEYDAIATECRKRHVAFAGHVPVAVSAEHTAFAGQHSIEHLGGRFYGVMLACSREESSLTAKVRELLAQVAAELRAGKEPDDRALFAEEFTRPLLETFDSRKASHLIRVFRDQRTWQCPTVVSWPLRQALARDDMSSSDRKWADALFREMQRLTSRIATENRSVLAGTDASLSEPKIHDELEFLVAAGLSPLDALRAATINPARYFGRTSDFGRVKKGQSRQSRIYCC
jgi:hypothetical protein